MSGSGKAHVLKMPNQDNDCTDRGQIAYIHFLIRNHEAPNSLARRDTSSTAC